MSNFNCTLRNAAIVLACSVSAVLTGCDDGGNPPSPPAAGTVRVTVEFTGSNFDVSSPMILLDGGSPQTGIGSPIAFNQVAPGSHEITLQGLHARCVRTGSAMQAATVTVGATTDIRYSVHCRDTDQLAYVANGLVISDADGQRAHHVFNPNQPMGAPSWSSDGRRLAINYDGAIWLINADGTDLRKLPWADPLFKPGTLSWSPDGTRLAFAMGYQASPMVSPAKMGVMDLTGTILGSSVQINGWFTAGSWAPDSSRFAYAAVDGNANHVTGVHVMSRDGAAVSYYSDSVSGGGAAAWSPNGQTILFPSNHELPEITPAGVLVRELAVCPSTCSGATWSPDGNTIVVNNTFDLRLIDTNGALLSVIPGRNGTPVWSPSGIYLAWSSESGLISAHPDGSGAVILNNDVLTHRPAWRP